MKIIKNFFKKFIDYIKSEPAKVKIEKPICHHCASRGVILHKGITKNEN
ncbi:MAG: hypothetical protein ACPL25_09375 [Ignavibacteria bacterium]